jgi:signal recognition particle receptor subunit beta
MVSINYSAREVCCKIVFYGPGLSGKTTNLQYIHSKVPQDTRGKLISLATEADRTLYFDFLPINIGTINDFQAKFQLYTVPGQVYYNATRKLVLRGVDGLVFVADSQADKMDENIESLANLEENLREYGYDISQLPLVIQYNKRDLPNVLSVEELNARLNPRGVPCFEAAAPQGKGVFDTLKLIIKLVLDKAKATGTSSVSRRAEAVVPPPAVEAQPYPSIERVPAALEAEVPATPIYEKPPQPVAAAPSWETTAQATPVPWPAQSQPVAVATDSAIRPYPGSDRSQLAELRRTGRVAMGTVTRELPADSLGKNIGSDSDDTALGASSMNTPQMAPSLRRRGIAKKRGFFKRLFGIK